MEFFLMNRIGLFIVWLSALLALLGFFLPWVKFISAQSGSLSDFAVRSLVSEEDRDYWRFISIPPEERKQLLKNPLQGTSGFELWKSWRKPAHPLPGADLFSTKRHLNSFWIFAVPASALLGAFFYTMTSGWGPFVGMGATLGTYLCVRWNIQEALLDRLVSGTHMGLGIWISLYALLLLSFCLSVRWAYGLTK
jgi:hypothetical protein